MSTYSFTGTESIGIPQQITLIDNSPSPSPGLTSRRVSFKLANGNWLNTSGESSTIVYETWPIADVSLTLTLLSGSTAMDITVEWLIGSTVDGMETESFAFVEFDYLFAYDLLGDQTSDPGITQDANYYSNFIQYIVNLFNGENAVRTGSDIYSSQGALNKNAWLEQNQTMFF